MHTLIPHLLSYFLHRRFALSRLSLKLLCDAVFQGSLGHCQERPTVTLEVGVDGFKAPITL